MSIFEGGYIHWDEKIISETALNSLYSVCQQWHTHEFVWGGGVQQIQLRTENREKGDLGVVAP